MDSRVDKMHSSSDSSHSIESSPEGSSRLSDSKSQTQTFKSSKPKISSTRLSPIVSPDETRDSNQAAGPTRFTLKDLDRMAELYPWPKGVTLCLPVENGDSLAKYPDSLVVHEDFLKAGFRLPVPTFVREFLRSNQICPAQLSPYSWRRISAFGIWCWKMNKEPTFLAMQYLFNVWESGKNVLTAHPNVEIVTALINGGYSKNKWFLVKKGDGYDFDFPIHPVKYGVKRTSYSDAMKDILSFQKREMKDIPGELQELMDAFLSLEHLKRIDRHPSRLFTHKNLENAGLSLPHPTKSKKPTLRLINSAIKKQDNVTFSRSKGDSKKKTVRSRSPPDSEDDSPIKKRRNVAPVQLKKTSLSRPSLATNSPHSPERSQPNILASRLTIEEANALFNGAIVNVDSVSALGGLSDERANSDFARSVALQVYDGNNLIQKHEKLFREKESAMQNEESLKREIQGLKFYLEKTLELNTYNLKRIQEQNVDNLKKIQEQNADNLKKIQEQNADNLKDILEENDNILKKAQDENVKMHQKIMKLETDLSKAHEKGNDELLSSKRNEEKMKNEIQSLEDKLKKTQEENDNILKKVQEENVEMHQITIELETVLWKEREKRDDELLKSKLKEEKMKNEVQSLENKLKKTQEEKASNLKKAQEENGELCRKIMELETDLSKMIKKGKEESRNEDTMKKKIQSLEGILKKTQEENDEQRRTIMKLKSDLSKAKDIARKELLDLKRNEKTMQEQFQMVENKFMEAQKDNVGLCQTITKLKSDLSKAKVIGKEEFLDSNGFYRRVAHFNATYYTSGIRVGVCQAVKKYQHLDSKIVEFEPDFDDGCGYEVPDPPPYSSPIRLVPNK